MLTNVSLTLADTHDHMPIQKCRNIVLKTSVLLNGIRRFVIDQALNGAEINFEVVI